MTTIKNQNGPFLTSKDGFNCYLLIVDEFFRHLCVFLFANKPPPIDIVTSFLKNRDVISGLRHVCTDQGGELAKSSELRRAIQTSWYTLETTGAGASFQNAIVERTHRQLANMMRTILSGANLNAKYWSRAIRDVVYIKKMSTPPVTSWQHHPIPDVHWPPPPT